MTTYLRTIPNLVILAPADENECRQMLYTAYQHPGPAAVRYPRGTGPGVAQEKAMTALPLGKGEMRRQGHKVAILAFGSLLEAALQAAGPLDASVANMRFVKPLDGELILDLAAHHRLLVTVEENAVAGARHRRRRVPGRTRSDECPPAPGPARPPPGLPRGATRGLWR